MAFRKKFEKILDEKPDVVVLQECENKEKLASALAHTGYQDLFWFGRNPHKGVGVITFNHWELEEISDFNPEYEYIIPLILKSKEVSINLFAIWAMPFPKSPAKSYVGQVWRAVNYYKGLLSSNSILIGDFNSNAIWDHHRKEGNHSELVDLLNTYDIGSLYHELNDFIHGKEQDPTIYLLKQKNKPYHLDYCFTSRDLITEETKVEVGDIKSWLTLSDHMPLIIDKLVNE